MSEVDEVPGPVFNYPGAELLIPAQAQGHDWATGATHWVMGSYPPVLTQPVSSKNKLLKLAHHYHRILDS